MLDVHLGQHELVLHVAPRHLFLQLGELQRRLTFLGQH